MKPRTYVHSLWETFSSTAYYRQVVQAPLGFSLRFFGLSMFLISMLHVGVFWRRDVPYFQQQFAIASHEFVQYFPADLKITWTGNELTTSATQPLPIYYPHNWEHKELPQMLGYVDTTSHSLTEIQQKVNTSALFFVTDKNIYLAQATADYRDLPLSEFNQLVSPFTLTKENVAEQQANFADQFWRGLSPFLAIGSFFYPLYLMASTLLSVTVMALLGWYLVNIFRKILPFKRVWQISLHLAVVAETVTLIQRVFMPQSSLPLFSLTFWIFFTLVMIDFQRHLAPQSK